MKILISPHSRELRWGNGKNPKNYPWWSQIFGLLNVRGHDVIQVGRSGESKVCHLLQHFITDLSMKELEELLRRMDLWISVDNFLPHLCHAKKIKTPGIVLWGQSDPLIFGYPEFTNLLKDRKYLRKQQFWLWEQAVYNEDAFVEAEEVVHLIRNKFEKTAEHTAKPD